MLKALFATVTNVSFDGNRIDELREEAKREKRVLAVLKIWKPISCGTAIRIWYFKIHSAAWIARYGGICMACSCFGKGRQ
jgi:hypothetical protein